MDVVILLQEFHFQLGDIHVARTFAFAALAG